MQFITRESYFWKFLGCKGKQPEKFEYSSVPCKDTPRYLHPGGSSGMSDRVFYARTHGGLGGFSAQLQLWLMLLKALDFRYRTVPDCGSDHLDKCWGRGYGAWLPFRLIPIQQDQPAILIWLIQKFSALSALPTAVLRKWIPCVLVSNYDIQE